MSTEHKEKPAKPARRKTTRLEYDERVDFVLSLMVRCATRGQIHQACRERYGTVWRTADRYVSRAKEQMAKNATVNREQMRAESLAVYESIIRGPASPSAKIRARERIDQLFGLEAPRRSEISGPEGGPVAVAEKVVILELPALDDRAAQDEAAVAAWRRERGEAWLAGRGGVGIADVGGKPQEGAFPAQGGAVSGNGGNGHNGHG